MSTGARRAGARLAASNAVKIRAALAQSANPHKIVSGYMDTHPQVTDSPAQDRARARAWVMLHVSLDMEAFKRTLRRTYAEFYALGINEAYEKLRAMKGATADLSKGGVATVSSKPGDKVPTFSIDWANWEPGNEAASLLLSAPGGLAKLLGDTQIQARGIADTTHDRLGTALAEGIAKGWTPQEIADSIGVTLSDPSRALTIALTEGQRAKIEANVQSYAENGVEQIEWTVNDPDDADCLDNDGQIVTLGDEFRSGDTQPPVHPNCQCDVIPVMPDLSAYPAIDLTTGDAIEESVTADLTKYSPDQERDEHGRFGSGNGVDLPTAFSETGSKYVTAVMTYNDAKDYQKINGGLRSGKLSAKFRETVDKINELIDKTPGIDKESTVYRGVSTGAFADQILGLQPGDTFQDKGFTSTTKDKDFAERFNSLEGRDHGALIQVSLPEGTKGLDMLHYWSDVPRDGRQHEFLLPTNSTFRVDAVEGTTVKVTLVGGN